MISKNPINCINPGSNVHFMIAIAIMLAGKTTL